jgi:Family of unknown function (DUF6152)
MCVFFRPSLISVSMYDMQHPTTVIGVVERVEWTSPHAYIYLKASAVSGTASATGVDEEWAIEVDSPNFLTHNGWTSTTVKPGDTIKSSGPSPRMHVYQWCQWLESTSVGAGVRNSGWLFPVIESVHTVGIVLLVGATGLFDLRLLGRGPFRQQSASQAQQVMPWVWGSFSVMFLTGVLMFSSEATRCYQSWCFRAKMVLLMLAGLNAFIFQFRA